MSAAEGLDAYGSPVAAWAPDTVELWDRAWAEFFGSVGDPIATLAPAIVNDEGFVLGPVVAATYQILSGLAFDTPTIDQAVKTARGRAAGCSPESREARHTGALVELVAGNFSRAAASWGRYGLASQDLVALRIAHDVWLHCGNVQDRLATSGAAVECWDRAPGWNLLLGMHSFSLEEAGHYDQAEVAGRTAWAADGDDLWALHALAHVYEMVGDTESLIELLDGVGPKADNSWRDKDSLVLHLWWHLAIRLIADGQIDRALAIFDSERADATTMFRLSDLISLLWRVELAGGLVGDRWDWVADRVAASPERHASGFLDLHAALTWARNPNHPGAAQFAATFSTASDSLGGEAGEIHRTVTADLVAAITAFGTGDLARAAKLLATTEPYQHLIGGSIAQRQIIALTAEACESPS